MQQAIQRSLQTEEDKRKIAVIEDEEIKRAIKLSLLDSAKPTPENNEKKEDKKEEKSEIKKEKPSKPEFKIEKKDMFNYQIKETPNLNITPIPSTKTENNIISSNTNFQFSGNITKEEKPNKPINIISTQKGFEFQIESKKNDFGISSNNDPFNFSNTNKNPYARPPPETSFKIEEKSKTHNKQRLIDDKPEEKKDNSPNYIEVQSKLRNEEKKEIKKEEPKEENKKSFNILQFEENPKEENIIIANEIKTKNEKASDIIKNTLKKNRNKDKNEDKDELLIDDDEEDTKNYKSNEPKTNTFIDNKKDKNLGKIKIGNDGGDFFNNFSGMKNYEKGGMQKMEKKIKENKFQSVINQNEEDEDYKNKLKEVEKEKQEKLKEYREFLLKMKKEKRENKAKEVLSPEELAKLESKKRLAEQLKARRK